VNAALPGLPGLDLTALTPWFREHVPGVAADVEIAARLVSGGKSNLTYELTDGTTSWIVRRPPLGHVLATAHDMGREYTVMTALRATTVPVPITYAICPDDAVLGAPFYVMEWVEGTPYRWASELAPLGAGRVRALSEQLVDVLAALHKVQPATIGLAEFGQPDGFLTRQVRRWDKQMHAYRTRALPAADELLRRLAATVENVERGGMPPRIVHGDFRLDNVLVHSDAAGDTIRAVIDWEMATLGDPLTDLALMLVYGRMAGFGMVSDVTDVAIAPGYLSEDEIIVRYDAASDRDLSHIGFYVGLAAYKLAAIVEGIHYRHLHGQTVGDGFTGIGRAVEPLLATGLDALDLR